MASADASDVVDAHVASLVDEGDRLLTNDREDLQRLLTAKGVEATLVKV